MNKHLVEAFDKPYQLKLSCLGLRLFFRNSKMLNNIFLLATKNILQISRPPYRLR